MDSSVVFSQLPINIETVSSINNGRRHSVYKLVDKSNNKYVVKIASNDRIVEFQKEAQVTSDLLVDSELTPSVIETNYKTDSEHKYILFKYVSSNPMKWYNDLFVINFITSLAKKLSSLHNSTEQFSRSDVPPPNSSSEQTLEKVITTTTELLENSKYEMYNPLINRISSLLSKNLPKTDTFVHYDVHLPNIRVRPDGTVKKFVDWETCCFSDPAYELAIVESRVLELYAQFTSFSREQLKEVFRKNYEHTNPDLINRLELYKVVYTIRTTYKMKTKMTFQPWKNQDAEVECWEAYEKLLPSVIDDAPL